MTTTADIDAAGGGFLPDFCSIRTLLLVLIVAELLAVVLVLGAPGPWQGFWQQLGVRSLFIQWVALASVACLCWSRPWLSRLDDRDAGLASYAFVLVVTAAVSVAALWGGRRLGVDPAQGAPIAYLLRHLGVSAVVGAVLLRFLYLGHHQRTLVRAQDRARIEALQARIRPHFLFNSMNTIAALIRTRPQQAEAAVEDLADLFRASLAEARERVPLHQELDTARRYMQLEALRLGERLQVRWDLDGLPTDLLLPPLVLQPLLENAIYHGIEQLPQGGLVAVQGRVHGGRLLLEVANPVPPSPGGHRGKRMALRNIGERLRLAYGHGAGLQTVAQDGGFRVRLTIPVEGAAP